MPPFSASHQKPENEAHPEPMTDDKGDAIWPALGGAVVGKPLMTPVRGSVQGHFFKCIFQFQLAFKIQP